MGIAEFIIGPAKRPDPLAQPILRASLQKDRIAAPQRNDAMGPKATFCTAEKRAAVLITARPYGAASTVRPCWICHGL
jgi:hypothetical protein